MDKKEQATRITDAMMDKDYFSQWLGIERLEDGEGISVLQMTVRKEMLNGFGIAHGGITYSLADSAFAFASNSHGRHAVSIETTISHTAPLREGDVLTARAQLDKLSNRVGWYNVRITNQNDELVALFKGTVYRKSAEWEV
ncbi:MAG: hydroxyphenylacetyl-CoA thioesterase PaaI [Bacteroidetes bacterium]|nr:hydroxyphenylacetyl-CoA thioesterase PaaI [Bacteroidota bacterium]